MDGWMDRWMDGWMDGWMDSKIKTFLFYIDTYILQSSSSSLVIASLRTESLNLSSYLQDQLIWGYICHRSKYLIFHLSLSKRKCSSRNLT